MPHEFRVSVVISLSDEPKTMAAQLGLIASAWAEFLKVGEDGIRAPTSSEFEVVPTRAKANGPRRGWKPKTPAAEESL